MDKSDEEVKVSSTYVLCDDTLTLVFNYMNPKEVFRLQRVSKQFHKCSEESFKKWKNMEFKNVRIHEEHVSLTKSTTLCFKSTTSHCIRIEFSELKRSLLNEVVFGHLNENLKNLKKLSLIYCQIYSFNEFVSSDKIKTFAKKRFISEFKTFTNI